MLIFPGENASKEERDRHDALIDALAQKAAYLELTGCVPNPLVLLHETGEDLTIKNQDATEYILRLGENDVTLPAKGSVTVQGSILGVSGNLGYACYKADDPEPSLRTVGVIHSRESL